MLPKVLFGIEGKAYVHCQAEQNDDDLLPRSGSGPSSQLEWGLFFLILSFADALLPHHQRGEVVHRQEFVARALQWP